MTKFDKFKARYDQAIADIERFLSPDSKLAPFTKWLLSTDINPYNFLPEVWAGSIGTAEGFSAFMSMVHHAVYDDGELTICTVNGRPRITFVDRYLPDFRRYALSAHELDLEQRFGSEAKIEILKLDINEFGILCDESETASLKKCFVNDAARNGVEFAVKHYSRYSLFSETWVDECSEEIANKSALLSALCTQYETPNLGD